MTQTILIVEDSQELAQLLSDYLGQAGFTTHCLYQGDTVIAWATKHQPDLILLDIMLPGKNGVEICREIRTISKVPIIMVTARVEEQDRLIGLDTGADDYICKPFSPREVVSRVKAVLRRVIDSNSDPDLLHLDAEKYQASINGNSLSLTVVEYNLLALLAESPGRVFSRSQLIERIYQDQRIVSDRTVDSHVKKLRKKISEVHDKELIHAVYSAGYKYEQS